jgi:hypothetical protein
MSDPVLHIVHAVDTEGPLDEDIGATFQRLRDLFGIDLPASEETLLKLQARELDLGGMEDKVATVFSPQLLRYNRNWADVRRMLDNAMSQAFRRRMVDDFGGGWVYSWHCVDHLGFAANPRHKDMGYGNVFRFYRQMIAETGSTQDELNFHFHPLSVTRNPLSAATSYNGSLDVLLGVIARRIIEDDWFPTTYRPGFHAERPDAHAFLEQWLPFDYANQSVDEDDTGQSDTRLGRFGDWHRAPRDWLGYHPHHDDHTQPGQCRRWIFRCLNVGTRFRLLQERHLEAAFKDACHAGSAIVAFADHDYRDMAPDVDYVRGLLETVRARHPNVKIKFNGAHCAAMEHIAVVEPGREIAPLALDGAIEGNRLHVRLASGEVFGPQPFLALRDRAGQVFHDNFDVVEPGRHWTYVFDDQTISLNRMETAGIGAAGRRGGFAVRKIQIN